LIIHKDWFAFMWFSPFFLNIDDGSRVLFKRQIIIVIEFDWFFGVLKYGDD